MTPQVTQEQIDLQNQLEIHTADLITKPLSNDSPILFLDTKETTDDPIQDQMEHQNIPEQQNISTIPTKNKKHLQTLTNLLILLRQQKRNMKL